MPLSPRQDLTPSFRSSTTPPPILPPLFHLTGRIPDESLRRLDFLLQGDPILERALEHIDSGDVVCLVAPSGRCVYTVASASAKKKKTTTSSGDGGTAQKVASSREK
jgi:hypothetical protein